ncbi:MAG: phosphoglucosamine mutase [Promethearchaeota archaeon]
MNDGPKKPQKLNFTTNGIRGIANVDLTPSNCVRIGLSIGKYLGPGKKAIIGADYRVSGHMIKGAIISGLSSMGVHIFDAGYTPTPALQKYIRDKSNFDLGLLITASHNPPEFNGIKIIDRDGIEISPLKEKQIEDAYNLPDLNRHLVSWREIGAIHHVSGVIDHYIESIIKNSKINKSRVANLRVVIDPGNGVTCTYVKELMERLNIKGIYIFDEPDGHFPNRVSEPTPDSLQALKEKVLDEGASFGVGFDGDGDRAIFIDDKGVFHWGDESFAVILNDILGEYKGWVVTPVSSSLLIQDIVEKYGAKLEWTKVGSITVSRRMVELNAKIGGEENGGIFFSPHQPVRDGGMALALIIGILTRNEKDLSELFADLPRYYLHKETIAVENSRKKEILEYIKGQINNEKRILIDGIKVIGHDGSVLIRPSGTEPKFRSFADGRTPEVAEKMSKWGIELVKDGLKALGSSRQVESE